MTSYTQSGAKISALYREGKKIDSKAKGSSGEKLATNRVFLAQTHEIKWGHLRIDAT